MIATSMVCRVGVARAASYGPPIPIGSGFSVPYGVAVDSAGDVFVADQGHARVEEVPTGGLAQRTLGSGFSEPIGVAVDGAGDVFVADYGANQVTEIPAAGGPEITLGTGLSGPTGVAVNAMDDVFIADTGNGRIVEVSAGGGQQRTIASGFVTPTGVALDSTGDVFVADQTDSQVTELPAGGGPEISLGSGLNSPTGVAVDSTGDVFVTDTNHNRVVEIPAGAGVEETIASGFREPSGIALDSRGDVFVSDEYNNRVVELPLRDNTDTSVSCPASGSAAGVAQSCTATVTDSTSPSSTPSGTVTFSASGAGSFSAGDSCTLASGSCSVTYTPSMAGSGSQVISAQYGGATTYLPSSGQGTLLISGQPATFTFTCSVVSGDDTSRVCSALAQATGRASRPTGSVAFSVSPSGQAGESLTPASCTLPSSGPNECFVTFDSGDNAGQYQIFAVYSGDRTYYAASRHSTAILDATATSVSCPASGSAAGVAQSCTATVTDSTSPSSTPSGTVTFSASGAGSFSAGDSCTLASGSCSVSYTPSMAGSGSQVISAQYGGATTYLPSSGQGTLLISGQPATFTFTCSGTQAAGWKCTATAKVPSGGARPTGTVAFSATPSGEPGESLTPTSCSLPPTGANHCLTMFASGAPAAKYRLEAAYSGDQRYRAAAKYYTLTVK